MYRFIVIVCAGCRCDDRLRRLRKRFVSFGNLRGSGDKP